MPVRKKIEASKQYEYSYEYLLKYIRDYIDTNYKNVSEFLRSDEFKELGFEDSSTQKARMLSLLSLPAEGEEKKTKSIPVIQKILKGLFDIDIKSEVKVVRTQIINSTNHII